MRIGILPSLDGAFGGIYQYSLVMLEAVERLREHEYVLLLNDPRQPVAQTMAARGWAIHPAAPPPSKRRSQRIADHVIGHGRLRHALRQAATQMRRHSTAVPGPLSIETIQRRPDLAEWWRACGIELMLCPAPTALPFEAGIPFVMAVHDIQHRLQPEFAEVAGSGEWERREYLYRHCSRHATLVLVNSEASKEDWMYFYGPYGADAERVRVLPYVTPPYLRSPSAAEQRAVAAKYGLPEQYFIYPAQFWPHKNHARLIEAFEHLRLVDRLEIPLVLCGSDSGRIREEQARLVLQMAEHCRVAGQIRWLTYVPDQDMASLYAGAVALVAPNLFGPNHLPPLEAWTCGCPVLTSDLRGIREQVEDAALLVDPRSVPALAAGIRELWTSPSLRQTLVQRGRARAAGRTVDDFRSELAAILDEARSRVMAAA